MSASIGYGRDSRDGGRPQRGGRQDDRGRAPIISVTKPTPCNVVTNLYKYTGSNLILHQYAVTFKPEVLPKNAFFKFLQMVEKNKFQETYAFDGVSILVSNKKFQDATLTMPMKDGDLVCSIEYKHTYDSTDKSSDRTSLMQCMEIISRYYQKLSFHVEKRKIFSLNSKAFDLGCGLEIQSGLSSSLKINRDGFYCNLDSIFGVFYKPLPMLDVLTQFCQSIDNRKNPLRDDMGSNFYSDFEKFIKSLKVETIHRERNSSFKVSGIICEPASSVEFEVDGKKQTVAEYFASTYKPLRYPQLPLVVVQKRSMTIYLPFEVLALCPMQKYSRKLDENLTSQMIRCAAKKPHERFALIAEKAADLCALQNSTLKQFGMAFDNKMLNCKGVIIPAPQIAFAGDRTVAVNNGSWNLIGVQALSGIDINNWKIFTFRSNNVVSNDTLSTFTSIASKYGVNFKSKPETVVVRSVDEFFNAKKEFFNLVILPDKSVQRYEEVKRIAETYQSVITQCMQSSNIFKLTNPSFVSNLLLKINTKNGGKNWALSKTLLQDKKTILIGIDVNHPGVTDLESPSIVSLVGSTDYSFTNYKTIIEQQERRKEIVGSLKENTKTLLKSHYASTKSKPERILVFRDGVGDSMFQSVYSCEIEAIEQACSELDPNYKPEINFVIAQKRHSVRFMSEGRNLVPGTIVDEIGTPDLFDFYLVSSNALQGTARPVRYLVIRNDSKFSNMEMYETVYHLCHLYARATKSVSVVPPIYYAHLGAARGKCYLEKNNEGNVVMRACSKDIQKNLYYL